MFRFEWNVRVTGGVGPVRPSALLRGSLPPRPIRRRSSPERAQEPAVMEPNNESTTRTAASSSFLLVVRSSAILSERQLENLERNVAEGVYPPEPAELADRLVQDRVL